MNINYNKCRQNPVIIFIDTYIIIIIYCIPTYIIIILTAQLQIW